MATKTWVIDPTHSELQFKIRHLMITNVTGSFSLFGADIHTEEDDFTKGNISFTADVNSVSTRNEPRDEHLKSADFFDAAQFPTITFVGTKAENIKADGSYDLHGDITIKGITKNIVVAVEFGGVAKDALGVTKAGFTINGKISRKEFGLTWSDVTDAGGIIVSDEVKIISEIQLIEQVLIAA